jgi:polyhydroxyalkanoate synthesis regulator phasin
VDKQLWAGVAVVVLGYVIGFYFQRRDIDKKLETNLNRRIDDLRSEMVARIDNLRSEMVARFEGLRDLLRSEIKRLEERIDRLEHPVART